MKPFYTFTATEKKEIFDALSTIKSNPYTEYNQFNNEIKHLISEDKIPGFFKEICHAIVNDRKAGNAFAHVIRNCTLDSNIPDLDQEDPFEDKVKKKKTFIGEALLAAFAAIAETPLLAYGNRFKGSFFADVIAVNRYSGHDSQFGDTELAYHNDRTAHPVRADYVTLLGTRCPQEELVFTGFISGRDIIKQLTKEQKEILRKPYYYTPFDIHSVATNTKFSDSDAHPIIEESCKIRYRDSWTTFSPHAPEKAKEALIAFMSAVLRADVAYHRMFEGDLFIFANQEGLHNRKHMEIINPEIARKRWLLKTYTFQDQATAETFAPYFKQDSFGCVDD